MPRARPRCEPLEDRLAPAADLAALLNPPPVFTDPGQYAVGSDVGGDPVVQVYTSLGLKVSERLAFDPGFRGGVKSALGDVNGDGVPDVIVAAGHGGGPRIRVFDGTSPAVLLDFFAYDPGFTGGVNVAAADLDGDGRAEIVTGAGFGGGPHLRVFGPDGTPRFELFPFEPGVRNGVHVAAADLDGDGRAEIVVGGPREGGPRVRVLSAGGAPRLDFFAYDPAFRGGVHVAAGDLDGDGRAEIVTGPGVGGGPHVRVFDLAGIERASFLVDRTNTDYGTPVAVTTPGSDGRALVAAASGPGGDGSVNGFRLNGSLAFTRQAFDHNEGIAFGSGSDYPVSYSEVVALVAALEEELLRRERAAARAEFQALVDFISEDTQ